MQEESDEQVPKNGVVLKSTDNDSEMQSEESNDKKDETITMRTRRFTKMIQKHPKFQEIWKRSTSKSNHRNSQRKFVSKVDTNQNSCYGYGLPGHVIKDCPIIKKKNKRTRFKSK